MKSPLLLTAITLGGCAQLVGIDDPAVRGDRDAAIDASEGPIVDANGDAPDGDLLPDGQPDAFEGPDADPAECGTLRGRFRDFKASTSGGHPDFESYPGDTATRGLVESRLGADGIPVLSSTRPANQIASTISFQSWYRDVAGTNFGFDQYLLLLPDGSGNLVMDNQLFFPLDNQGFDETFIGEDNRPHNFHFTTEVHGSFIYQGGERITVYGDDDIWIFINDNLALDIGGTHPPVEASVALDTLGLNPGQRYQIHIFQAERFTIGSHLRITTTIDCLLPP